MSRSKSYQLNKEDVDHVTEGLAYLYDEWRNSDTPDREKYMTEIRELIEFFGGEV